MNPGSLKTIRKILIVLCIILIIAAAVVFFIRSAEEKKDNKLTEEKNNQIRYSYASYGFNEVGKLDPSEVNLDDYESLSKFGNFFALENSPFLEQALEFTYNSAVDNEYFVENECYSCELNESGHYFFFGKDKENLPFYMKVSEQWDITEWYVRKDFVPPTVKVNRVSEIVVISANDAEKLLSKTLTDSDLCRINTDDLPKITDKAKIKQCVTRYGNEVYAYDDEFDLSIAEAKQKTMCGYVLACFENSNVYQCIGVY